MVSALIVDDSKTELDVIRYLIQKNDLSLETDYAQDGEQALEILKSKSIDLLITDIRMPFIDGLTLTQEAIRINENIKVVINSGYGDFSYAKTAISLGVKEYLLKPLIAAEFVNLMNRLILEITEEKRQNNTPGDAFDELPPLSGIENNKVRFICEYIASHYSEDLSLESLAQVSYLHPDYLSRVFKKETGMNLNHYIKTCRLNEARKRLETTQQKITSISAAVGYQNCAYFIRNFTLKYGTSPEKYRQNFRNQTGKKEGEA